MTKAEKFQADEGKRDILAEALPVVLEALEALKDQLGCHKPTNEGVINPQVGNSYFQQDVGANYLIAGLSRLTKPAPEGRKAPQGRRQYTEADRDELKRRQKE